MFDKPESALGTFSDEMVEALRQLGWREPDRSTIERCIRELEARGFHVNEVAQAAIEQFAGLEFTFPEGGVPWVRFDLTEPRHTFIVDHLSNLTELLEEEACPIGGGGGYIILICPSGRAAVLHEQWSFLLSANSLATILEAVAFGNRANCHEYPDVESHRPM
ncbi:MAG: hypothetical protein GXX96_32245 [Planctomycetaceae bacterium]|nr:hypothetical protein [Planctomycetaceae bacterium]